MLTYELYGLRIASERPIPGLRPHGGGAADVTVRFQPPPALDEAEAVIAYASEPEDGAPPALVVSAWPARRVRRLAYAEGIRFFVSDGGHTVTADWDPPLTIEDAATFLLGPVLGCVLRERGVLALHAGAVSLAGLTAGFVGPGGAGKSTLVAAASARGAGVITDDVLALLEVGGRWCAQPGATELRLWDESTAWLLGAAEALPTFSTAWPKRRFDVTAHGGRHEPAIVPLDLLLVLEERGAPTDTLVLEPLRGSAAVVALLANTYANYLLAPPERASELAALGRLLGAVPCWRVRMPDAFDAVPTLLDRLPRLLDAGGPQEWGG